jgi:hypothetical protein
MCVFLPSTSAENPYLDQIVTTHELVAEKTFNGFTTSWYYSPGLTTQEYIIAIKNLEDENRETNITSLISNTNFNLYGLSNILFEEYKLVPYTYTINHYDETEHSEWNETNQTWNNWTESVFNYTETIESEKLDFKPCKMNAFSLNNAELKENYGYMLIPKYDSKDKGDGTFNGTKIFKLTFNTPIKVTPNGFGSSGMVALLLDEIEFCPYWNTTFSSRLPITITTDGNSTPANYQVLLNISYEPEMQIDFDDIRFTNSSNGEIAYWIESKVDSNYANVWVNLSDAITDPGSDTILMYYGNADVSDGGNIGDMAVFGDNFTGDLSKWTNTGASVSGGIVTVAASVNNNIASIETFGQNYIYRARIKAAHFSTVGYNPMVGFRINSGSGAVMTFYNYPHPGEFQLLTQSDAGANAGTIITPPSDDEYHIFELTRNGNINTQLSIDDSTPVVNTNNIPTVATSVIIRTEGASAEELYGDWVFVRKYITNEPIVSYGSPQVYVNSIHYNATTPYNHTIESDGTITANRSIIAADDTNDTVQSTGTSYLIINVYDNAADIIRNFTFTGDTLDWYQAANLSGTYNLKNSSGIIETQDSVSGLVNFTIDLVQGTYWIEKKDISISLVSFTPSPLYTNYTGTTVISYMVQSTKPLNLSSLAFLYGLNYTITGDMHNYIGVPPCDIGYDGIYRAPNRNVTPYLSWEFNDTITGGNVWQWGGGDNNSWWIEKNQINATNTWVNVTGVTQHILPSSFYIQKLAMYNAPKTGFEINRQQGLILKMWNVEEIRNRNANYFANLYFDTSWESTLPTHPVEVGFCNYSYDPAVDDIDTCPDCIKFGEWDGNRWVKHSWVPGPNASYALPFVVNGSQYTEPIPDDINYIWMRSNTISSKSFVLNATNYDPGITNISFAETNTLWIYNELNGVTTPVAYTPSFFTTFVRDHEELLHHLYIADDTGTWGHSEIFNETIGLSSVPVLPVSFEHFNVTCQGNYIEDTLMDATYDEGSILVNIHCPADPDGGTVSHNLTLHYSNNQTLVAVINDTFTTTGDEYVDINFTTTPYYSSSVFYTLRCVSADDENDVATKWLISDFTLDADGNQGWVVDDALLFWGMNNIPALYATIANDSLISYNAGNDIYTMHVPFFKSKSNDTFYFNETVHLESLNNENVSYFRHSGHIIYNYATIHAWNTTTDIAAPITDEYRSYVYSHFHVCGNITNSDFSYLGSDFYRQEGLNFIDNPHDYLIYNTTFSHNAEGPVMEYCSNMNISQCTITDNVNVGIGMYFTNDTTANNNTISSNGGRGISIYDGHNNIINYNDIIGSGVHGIHLWSNSGNNIATANDISGSALYDYYLSSSSLGNYIIDPASTIDRIRVTSTSSVNIENTDNAVFTEDSLNTSYAYLTNFSMFVSGVSQTFDITQRDMTILPSTDKVAIWNLEWDTSVVFNATSDTDINPTWFNITKSAWSDKTVYVYLNDIYFTNQTANATGILLYNYSESLTEKRFEFRTTLISILGEKIPLSIFVMWSIIMFGGMVIGYITTGIYGITSSLLTAIIAYMNSKNIINGNVVQFFAGESTTDTIQIGYRSIESLSLSYIFLFISIVMVIIFILQVINEVKYNLELDMDGDFLDE